MQLVLKVIPRRAYGMANLKCCEGSDDLTYGTILSFMWRNSTQVESGLQSALHLRTVWLLTEGDDTRGCGDTICPPENEGRAARNMLRSVV